jgi:hypothetical protein
MRLPWREVSEAGVSARLEGILGQKYKHQNFATAESAVAKFWWSRMGEIVKSIQETDKIC